MTFDLPKPTPLSYWVSQSLLAGEHPSHNDGAEQTKLKLQKYLDCGVTYFFDLTQFAEKNSYEEILKEEARRRNIIKNIGYTQVPMHDDGTPTNEQMKEVLDAIDEAIAKDHKVYVHCRGGIGRTGTAVGCYLVRHGHSGDKALEIVERLFQTSDPSRAAQNSPATPEQKAFVRNWCE